MFQNVPVAELPSVKCLKYHWFQRAKAYSGTCLTSKIDVFFSMNMIYTIKMRNIKKNESYIYI